MFIELSVSLSLLVWPSRCNALNIVRRHHDAAAEARVCTNVLQLRCVLRSLMQQPFDASPFARLPVVVLFGPTGLYLYNERFAILIEWVGHGWVKTGE